ncbi:S1C family serine protease [Desulfosporosinus meridiei]|uniref:Trypsin-like serine protease with C-terminal PDZ domain n=1 Tax=Desulfosporosinus meridiei (strain ATCC BAA-275 / DSM 13257 / KCTC 12902 / NCIMB 13706 / S10) TaxID=768704 RepID=J7IMP7_DESMD|nr:trypsin-like peptidase domain-containing protein [Desulfosporosinus meridiei]AFQ42830.1 trypsin-like serine protease with C-terminal PDZ domain [Desulfosporosinus meridiei DSM 13257]
MEEDVRSTLNDNINNFSNSNNTQSISRPRAPGRVLAYASLCLISAAIGGLSTIAAIPYIYPTSTVAPLQTANSSFTQVANYTTDQTIYPVAQIAKNVGPAVVGVANFQTGRSFSGKSALQEVGSGSGFIIDVKKGYIATNNHVIEGAQKITVSLSDGRTLEAKLIGADPRTDLAVLQISDTTNLTAVELGDSSKIEVGQSVVAIGNPGGDEFARSVTTGVISATNRTLNLQGVASYNLIQTDAAINPGNSGGPLVNYQGQVIGINSVKYAETGFEGMGFAIPISDALPTIQQLITSGVAKHPALLVSTDDQYNTYAKTNNKPQGAYISAVTLNGPAAKAGIQQGDVITKINDTLIQNSSDLVRELYKNKVGDKVTLTYIRDGQTKQAEAVLGELAST